MEKPSTSAPSSLSSAESSLSSSAEPSVSRESASKPTSKKRQPNVSDATERVHFLHQAANLLATTTDSQSSTAAKLARIYLTDMKEVCFIGMTRVDRGIRRSYCKKCKQPWLGSCDGNVPFKLKLGKNRRLRQVCRNCETEKAYLVNTDYLSRSEQHLAQKEPVNSN